MVQRVCPVICFIFEILGQDIKPLNRLLLDSGKLVSFVEEVLQDNAKVKVSLSANVIVELLVGERGVWKLCPKDADNQVLNYFAAQDIGTGVAPNAYPAIMPPKMKVSTAESHEPMYSPQTPTVARALNIGGIFSPPQFY